MTGAKWETKINKSKFGLVSKTIKKTETDWRIKHEWKTKKKSHQHNNCFVSYIGQSFSF